MAREFHFPLSGSRFPEMDAGAANVLTYVVQSKPG